MTERELKPKGWNIAVTERNMNIHVVNRCLVR